MEYAITLRLDTAADADVRGIWQAVADAGIGDYMLRLNYPPHLTLAIVDEKTPTAVVEAAFDVLDKGSPVALQLGEVRRFEGTSVVWLAADRGAHLASLHRMLMASLPEECVHPHYRADVWVPHVTLYQHGDMPEQAEAIAKTLWSPPRPVSGSRLELVQFPPVAVLRSMALGTKKEAPAETGAL
ncbi:2'-5' RNA ligase family protein [Devosia nitrariae]|uniref:2'-5' RNA ligase n=1 Tax=Devosia nitrariae TaxID=2071872 RepID=A0ABQ5VZA2_9HYPH|nr:2'-5' RNA ligase family protein [Devosia nitrariae]GLQ52831.1 2'-5' RNA ligase [Devosia nitrariae]